MKVKWILLNCFVTLSTCQNRQTTDRKKVQGEGRTVGLIQPILGLGSGLLGGGLFGDSPPAAAVQNDQYSRPGYGSYGAYPGYYGAYPSYYGYGGYRPSRRPGLLSLLTAFGGYSGGYGVNPGYASYAGYPAYAGSAGYNGYGGYPSYSNFARPYPAPGYAGASSTATPAFSSNSGVVSSPNSISPDQAAQLGQSLGTLLRPLLSNSGGSASPDAANSLISLLG